jgi:hypothetical protein
VGGCARRYAGWGDVAAEEAAVLDGRELSHVRGVVVPCSDGQMGRPRVHWAKSSTEGSLTKLRFADWSLSLNRFECEFNAWMWFDGNKVYNNQVQ